MRNGDLERSIAVDSAKREIAARVRPVCDHLCDEEFDALVQRMAEIDVHFRLLSDWTVPGLEEEGATSGSVL
jgi:hypothetical protein